MTENNQFLDPPIAPQYRSDEPETLSNQEELDEVTRLADEPQQNEGYRSECRE
ncbi:hypothetical protein [Cohnella yongneupensis]|uniref:Uncharacterized protein n=1 Tax=Cohnella yongneupensis TaxID=425006 RepID=A0ABW0QUY9_9BACL